MSDTSSRLASLSAEVSAEEMGITPADIWPVGDIRSVGDAILHTLIYADLFDYPLTSQEIHLYLTGSSAPLPVVEEHLARDGHLGQYIGSVSTYWFLAGREHLVGLRREREAFSQILWPKARRYAHLIAAIPFVRMVSVTGSLAMNNVISAQDDIDLLIVAAENRVWLARGLAILVVHLARRSGVNICPNYVIAEHCLELGEPNVFTAHEVAQLVPLHGLNMYHRLLERNAWVADLLPNALSRRATVRGTGTAARLGQRVLEAALEGSMGDAVERWERERKIPRLRQLASEQGGSGAMYTPDVCKGHANDHAAGVYQRYVAHLAAHGMSS